MNKRKILVVSDNETIISFFIKLLEEKPSLCDGRTFDFACAPWDKVLVGKKNGSYKIEPLDMKRMYETVIENYDLVISAHCKQLFPDPLTTKVKCINIHPGLNPYNRGWYPQVFSIMNGLPLGATIHEIDSKIDHGAIIDQLEVAVLTQDTSLEAYNKVLAAEEVLLRRSLESILNDTYTKRKPIGEGNLNLKKDFDALCKIDLDKVTTYGEVINTLRALTHGSFKNAYFYDPITKKNIYVTIQLEAES